MTAPKPPPPRTPDGRYIVVKERLWRATNPALSEDEAAALTQRPREGPIGSCGGRSEADDAAALRDARTRVQAAKVGLGERGPVWWSDGERDFNRCLIKNTPYAAWWAGLDGRLDACLD